MDSVNKNPMIGGYNYEVSDEQLKDFAKLTVLQRLQWVEDARLFTLMMQTEETRRRHHNLRCGGNIDD